MRILKRLLVVLPAWLLLAVFSPIVLAESVPFDPADPPNGLFADDWAEVHMFGGKVGYAHTQMRRNGDSIRTDLRMVMKLGRADQSAKIGVEQTTNETLAGRLLDFESAVDMGFQTMRSSGKVEGDKLNVSEEQFGHVTRKEIDFPADTLMLWGLLRKQLDVGFEAGVEFTANTFDLQTLKPISTVTRVGEWESVEFGGRSFSGFRVMQTLTMSNMVINGTSWADKDGRVLLAEMDMFGLGKMRLLTVDQKTALTDFVPPETFMTNTFKVPRIDIKNAREIRFKVSTEFNDESILDFPNTGMQKVEAAAGGDRAVIVTVGSQANRTANPDKRIPPDSSNPALAEYLESNLTLNLHDLQLQDLAKQAAGNASGPFELANNLRKFVRRHIRNKSFDVAFATASEVARTREGDCSEHGVLLAALGRINGLPSRVALGIAYAPTFGRKKDIMGYHMWTQFFINGQWYDYDAALFDEDVPNPARIAFAVSSLGDAGLADLSLALLPRMGRIKVEVLEVSVNGAE